MKVSMNTWAQRVGDHISLTAVARNIKNSIPDVEIGIDAHHGDMLSLFRNNPDFSVLLKDGKIFGRNLPDGTYVAADGKELFKADTQLSFTTKSTDEYSILLTEKHTLDAEYMLRSQGILKIDEHLSVDQKNPILCYSKEEEDELSEKLNLLGIHGTLCVLNHNDHGNCKTKRWPWYQKFVDLARDRHLADSFLQIGSSTSLIPPLTGKETFDLRGKTTLRGLVILLSKSSFVVTPPSGALHIAASFPSTKIVSLVGSRENKRICSYENTISLTASCSRFSENHTCGMFDLKFGRYPCTDVVSKAGINCPSCMASISPKSVLEALDKLSPVR